MKGRLVILSGPSGVGKDTLLEAWSQRNPRVQRVVAYCTRKPRSGEVNGVDYHFVSEAEFHDLAEAGAFLEFKNVHGNWYATPIKEMKAMLDHNLIAVLKIDVKGAISAMELRPDAVSIFILPPSTEELERRLRGRQSDDEAATQARLETALAEMSMAHRYQYQVVNDTIVKAVSQLQTIVESQ